MYESFFGLRERPFELTPDPRYLFLSPSHKEAMANLQYGIAARKAVTVLVGEVGAGKTTLLTRTLTLCRDQGIRMVLLNNPTLSREEFTQFLAHQFELSREAAQSKPVCLAELQAELQAKVKATPGSILVVDEAQVASDALLEELRLLTNLETERQKLLPLVLVGQPELAMRLREPALRHLKQRVALRCSLSRLDLSETAAYIASRITVAGGKSAELFTREAVSLIHAASGGLPRAISVLCDNALVTGFAAQKKPVGAAIVRDVCRDFDMEVESAADVMPLTVDREPSPAPPAATEEPAPRGEAAGQELFGQFNQRRRFSMFGMGR